MDKINILQIHNIDNRLEKYIPFLDQLTQQYGKKEKNYYIIPILDFQTGVQHIDVFFNLLSQKCLISNYATGYLWTDGETVRSDGFAFKFSWMKQRQTSVHLDTRLDGDNICANYIFNNMKRYSWFK